MKEEQKKIKQYITYLTKDEYFIWRDKIQMGITLNPEIAALLIGRAQPEYEEEHGITK